MASNDLIFSLAPLHQPAALVFDEAAGPPNFAVTVAVTLPDMTVAAEIAVIAQVNIAVTLPALTVAVQLNEIMPTDHFTAAVTLPALMVAVQLHQPAIDVTMLVQLPPMTALGGLLYSSNTERPTVAKWNEPWQPADRLQSGATDFDQRAKPTPGGADGRWQAATPVGTTNTALQANNLVASRVEARTGFEAADLVKQGAGTTWRALDRTKRPTTDTSWQAAQRVNAGMSDSWQERYRDRRPTIDALWQKAIAARAAYNGNFAKSEPVVETLRSWWDKTIQPQPGTRTPIIPPEVPCYIPPPGSHVDLVFSTPWSSDTSLVFVCEQKPIPPHPTIIVPIKDIYTMINSTTLTRVDTGQPIPCLTMTLTLDIDSWTWGFTAQLPQVSMPLLVPGSDGAPALLEAVINGIAYRVLAENVSTVRTFNSTTITLTARGKSAILDAPYAPVQQFYNTAARTAQQLMADVLTVNGVPMGWEVVWTIDDWLVPASAFSAVGSYMDALNAIAKAAGAYIQPHPTDDTIIVQHSYPEAPWDWSTVTPDYEIPSAVATQDGITWKNQPNYNRVYVSGTSQGITGKVTRTGTAGDIQAPDVSDPLITDTPAARQRGRAILSDTGKQITVQLVMPVLPETGIILPGKFVRYTDGLDIKVGIVRNVSVTSALPETWQTLGVETHVD